MLNNSHYFKFKQYIEASALDSSSIKSLEKHQITTILGVADEILSDRFTNNLKTCALRQLEEERKEGMRLAIEKLLSDAYPAIVAEKDVDIRGDFFITIWPNGRTETEADNG